MISQDKVRLRAFELWETEGRPHGRDVEHWLRAEAEIGARVAPAPRPRKPAAAARPARKSARASAKV